MLKIATWNVNSIRKRVDQLCDFIVSDEIDIVLLQEIKCTNEQFPYEQIEDLGYKCIVHGQKARNGVAILSKYKVAEGSLKTSIIDNEEARYLECLIEYNNFNLRVASVYVPNGQSIDSEAFRYKLHFFDALYQHLHDLFKKEEVTIIGGDYNVAPHAIDVHDLYSLDDQVCFSIKEREKFYALCNLGYNDAFRIANPDNKQFSWWDYQGGSWQRNRGMRIDHILLSPEATDRLEKCYISNKLRGKDNTSDHAPVVCVLEEMGE
ncbi:MAG: exodeoxyribonuclease III [Candidatus Mesenet longicola]|uniref:Exodeoxyribonuclease III n=1 Tax=Candidatus Mesenet longicola TaxID=1892558 RepID=A0A8J3HVT0_9RICK|nr:MAG: exodeoxyribonuclease III [Candidatus Mesenet longicola]GHM60060.1 MAG: exodeoxyribonuclease III [Candidatus Mesenet longicola]